MSDTVGTSYLPAWHDDGFGPGGLHTSGAGSIAQRAPSWLPYARRRGRAALAGMHPWDAGR